MRFFFLMRDRFRFPQRAARLNEIWLERLKSSKGLPALCERPGSAPGHPFRLAGLLGSGRGKLCKNGRIFRDFPDAELT